jgi:hypothetical protein
MYGCGFADLDGHRWNVLYMDMSKCQKATGRNDCDIFNLPDEGQTPQVISGPVASTLPARETAAGFRRFLQAYLHQLRKPVDQVSVNVLANIFAGGVFQARNFIQNMVIELLQHGVDDFTNPMEIDHPADLGIAVAHQPK